MSAQVDDCTLIITVSDQERLDDLPIAVARRTASERAAKLGDGWCYWDIKRTDYNTVQVFFLHETTA